MILRLIIYIRKFILYNFKTYYKVIAINAMCLMKNIYRSIKQKKEPINRPHMYMTKIFSTNIPRQLIRERIVF